MNYNIQDICCFCLSLSNEKCSNNLIPFDKIKTVFLELSAVMCSDSRICMTCSKNVDFIYEFNKTCLRNINILNSYKKVLKENKPEKKCELFVNLDEWKQFKDKLISEDVQIESSGSPLSNIDTLCDADFVSESHSSGIAEVKEEIQINYVNCDEESERSWLGSEIKIEIEESDLKQEWTSEISDPLMDESTIRDFENSAVHSTEEAMVKEEKNSELFGHLLEVTEENSGEKLRYSESQVQKQSDCFEKKPIQADDHEFDLDRHLLSHSKTKNHIESRAHKCDICGKLFTQKSALNRHMLIHTGEKRNKCDICGKLFREKGHLVTHMRLHTGEKPHKCDICERSFNHKGNLNAHILTHTEEKPHKCDTCGKSFSQKRIVELHMLTHTGEGPHKCHTCGKSFIRKRHLESHTLTHTGEKPYICNTCGKSFNRRDNLKLHMLIHTGEKPYKCDICGKSYSQNRNLKLHMQIHTGESPHKCNTCGKSFSQKCNLELHILIHTGEKPHKCDTCGKSFTHKAHLKNHMHIHSGEKPYKCYTCGKSFNQKRYLESHMPIHTGKNTHK